VGDVITDAKFYGNRLRGFGVTGPPQTPFLILNVHRSYNSVSTTVLHCGKQHVCTYLQLFFTLCELITVK